MGRTGTWPLVSFRWKPARGGAVAHGDGSSCLAREADPPISAPRRGLRRTGAAGRRGSRTSCVACSLPWDSPPCLSRQVPTRVMVLTGGAMSRKSSDFPRAAAPVLVFRGGKLSSLPDPADRMSAATASVAAKLRVAGPRRQECRRPQGRRHAGTTARPARGRAKRRGKCLTSADRLLTSKNCSVLTRIAPGGGRGAHREGTTSGRTQGVRHVDAASPSSSRS
jgi:hypothetical protein